VDRASTKTGEEVTEKASAKYYALVIGQTKYRTASQLPGCTNDKVAVAKMLKGLKGSWKVKSKGNLTATQMRSAIKSAFKKSKKKDVCLFYYSGHGVVAGSSVYEDDYQGALVGVDGSYLLGGSLATELKKACKGKCIVILDSCGSGGMVAYRGSVGKFDKIEDLEEPQKFVDGITSTFSYFDNEAMKEAKEEKISELRDGKFVVITAAAYRQTSLEMADSDTGYRFGLFTLMLCKAIGFEHQYRWWQKAPCDTNRNKQLTWNEVGSYTAQQVYNVAGSAHAVCGYSANPNFVMFKTKK
jgi:hypothetical protein